MAFSLDTRNVNYLHNYEAALRHHNNITPIRNSDCRPVENRRKAHFNIRKEGEGNGGKIIVRLHRTDIVTYYSPSHAQYPNQISLNMGNWPSVSTRGAIRALTGIALTRQHNKAWVRDADGRWFLFENNMALQAGDYYRDHKIINPVFPTIHTLKRKELNAKLKQFKDYYNYMVGLAKVDAWRGQMISAAHALNALQDEGNYRDGVFSPDPETAFELSRAIMGNQKYSGKNAYWRFFVTGLNPNNNPTNGLNLEGVITKALKQAIIEACNKELLVETPVTTGVIARDQYAWIWE
jgi:hypothetical protein